MVIFSLHIYWYSCIQRPDHQPANWILTKLPSFWLLTSQFILEGWCFHHVPSKLGPFPAPQWQTNNQIDDTMWRGSHHLDRQVCNRMVFLEEAQLSVPSFEFKQIQFPIQLYLAMKIKEMFWPSTLKIQHVRTTELQSQITSS